MEAAEVSLLANLGIPDPYVPRLPTAAIPDEQSAISVSWHSFGKRKHWRRLAKMMPRCPNRTGLTNAALSKHSRNS